MNVRVCMYVCVRERERERERETRCVDTENTQASVLTKEKTQLLYKAGGGRFI